MRRGASLLSTPPSAQHHPHRGSCREWVLGTWVLGTPAQFRLLMLGPHRRRDHCLRRGPGETRRFGLVARRPESMSGTQRGRSAQSHAAAARPARRYNGSRPTPRSSGAVAANRRRENIAQLKIFFGATKRLDIFSKKPGLVVTRGPRETDVLCVMVRAAVLAPCGGGAAEAADCRAMNPAPRPSCRQ